MKKITAILLATTLAGSLGAAALTPALAQGWNNNSRSMMGQNWNNGQNRMGYGHMERGWGHERGMSGWMMGRQGGAMLNLVCSPNGAVRLGAMLGGLEQRLQLTDAQQPLFDDLKTTALAAQADFAKTCPTTPAPRAGQGKNAQANSAQTSIVDRLKTREARLQAEADALGKVLPKLQALYDSLTDTQKQALSFKGMRGNRGWGQHHRFGANNQAPMAPGAGQGMMNQNAPGQGNPPAPAPEAPTNSDSM